MPELTRQLLTEYVDEQTPEQAPPFEGVRQGVRRKKRQRGLLAVAAVVAVATATALGTTDLRGTDEPAAPVTTPTTGVLDDGPPPAQFKFGTTLMLLQEEIPVTAVRPLPGSPSVLVVETSRRPVVGETCLPHTVVRILDQDAATVRIAAYRYSAAPDEPGGGECAKPPGGTVRVHLDLRSALGDRTVLAGSTGQRVALN